MALQSLWREYQGQGPGNVSGPCWQEVQQAKEALDATLLPPQIDDAVTRLHELARRCAKHPQGLSFVTGEGGLVPRNDLHAAFESAVQELATYHPDA